MSKIYELIGIINGINYDGIINELEIAHLKNWVNCNRNEYVKGREKDLIRLLDQILKDHIITNEERNILLDCCKNFQESSSDKIVKFYEINGIIEGIICDEEININEIENFKKWLRQNENEIILEFFPIEIRRKIDKIISRDNFNIEEEKKTIIAMYNYLKEYRWEIKLRDIKNNIHRNMNIGMNLINMIDDEEIINKIHRKAEIELDHTLNTYSCIHVDDPDMVFISLCLIGLLHYDKRFYNHTAEVYKDLYKKFPSQKIDGLIRSVINRYKNQREINNENGRRNNIINTILVNTIVPKYYLQSFFDFIFDIYKINFNYNINDDLYCAFKFIYEGLKKDMMEEDESFKLELTKKSYKLIKSTKELIVDDKNIDAIIELSIRILKLIDRGFWNQGYKVTNPYILEGYERWLKTIESINKESINRNNSKKHFRMLEKLEYALDGYKLILKTPIHRVKKIYDYKDIYVVVENNNEIIYENRIPKIREIIGGYEVEGEPIKLDKFYNEITYYLKCKNEVIYTSKEKLHCKFLIFDGVGNRIKNYTDYEGNIIICCGKKIEVLNELYNSKDYFLLEKSIASGDIFELDGEIHYFTSLNKSGIYGEQYKEHYLLDERLKEIPVYKSFPKLYIEKKDMIDVYKILINGKNYRLDSFKNRISKNNYEIITLDTLKSGIYNIKVVVNKSDKILDVTFAIDDGLQFECEYDNEEYCIVEIKSSLLGRKEYRGIDLRDYAIDWLKFYCNGRLYSYVLSLGIKLYRLKNSKWNNFDKELWIEDIGNKKEIECHGFLWDSIEILSSEGNILDQFKGEAKSIDLSFLISYKNLYDYVVIAFKWEDERVACIFVYNKCVLDNKKTLIEYNHKTRSLEITPIFYGKGNIILKIENEDNVIVYKSKGLEKNQRIEIMNLPSFVKYKVSFYKIEKRLFSVDCMENLLGYRYTVFYDRDDFINKLFKIKKVYYEQILNGELQRKRYDFGNTYLSIDKLLGNNKLLGSIYYRVRDEYRSLNKINPVEIELCSDVIYGSVEVSITKEGDGLLMDFYRKGILNSTYDKKALDIYSYFLEVE